MMRTWKMWVYPTRAVNIDDQRTRLHAQLSNLTGFGSSTGRTGVAAILEVSADTRTEAEEVARADVEAVLGPGLVEAVVGHDDTMQDRQMMLWICGTRWQVRRWEVALAAWLRPSLDREQPGGALTWQVQIEWHLALVAGNNLLRAVSNTDGRYLQMPSDLADNLRILRDTQEHWDEQLTPFYNSANPGPLQRSGKAFAALHPGRSPHWWLGWNSESGPELGPGLRVEELWSYLDDVEAQVVASNPDLAGYVWELPPSPWIGGDDPQLRWWLAR